jgi:hypothetical protein
MANLSNINNKFLVTTGGNVLIGQTGAVGSSIFQVSGDVQLGGATPTLNFYKTSNADILANIKVESDTGTGGKLTIQTKRNGNTASDALVIYENQNATFAGIATINGAGAAAAGSINLVSEDPFIRLYDNGSSSTTDKKKWDIRAIGHAGYEMLEIRTVNDANNVFSTKLSIAHNGNVGIGTTSPDLGAVAGTRVLTIASPTAERWGILELAGNRTWGGNQVGELKFISTDSTNNGTLVSLTALNDPTATGTGGSLKFNTKPNGGSLVERMQIKSNGQVNISQKPNSGLEYDLLINLGTSPDGLVGYQTREQFNNATLQKWYNVDAANSGSSQWVRLGTMSNFAQGGYTFCLTFYGHTGYNASNTQDWNCKLFMKTSNGAGTGPRFNSWVENTGKNQASPAFKWINTNSSGTPTVGGTSFELYMNVPSYSLGSIYAINKHSGDWTSENAIGQSDPGADSTTVLQAQNVFNILNTDVGIGTVSPSQKLEVTGNTYVTGYVQASSALIGYKSGFATFGSNSTATGIALSRDFLPSSYPDLIINSSGSVGIGVSAESTSRLHVKYISGGNNCKMTLESNNSGDSFINYSAASNEMSAGFDTSAAQFIIAGGDNLSVPKFALTQSTGDTTIAGTLTQNSDITLKENIKPLKSQLEIVSKLNPVSYNKIGFEDNEVGFIEQEVEKLLPELVREDKDGLKSLAYGNMNAILVKAIQELKAEIELLKSK